MPMNRSLYPSDWKMIAHRVKEAANWTCQECGRQCRRPGQDWADFAEMEAEFKPMRWVLTVAHLNHRPSDCSSENLRALCSGCHLRYDNQHRTLKRRALKAEREISRSQAFKTHSQCGTP